MGQEIHITLRFSLANGKVGLNEITERFKKIIEILIQKQSVVAPRELYGDEPYKLGSMLGLIFFREVKNEVMP